MTKLMFHLFLVSMLGLLTPVPSLADNCTSASQIVDALVTKPPAANTQAMFGEALQRCPEDAELYSQIGDYYKYWWKHDISNPEAQAMHNYLATEYYARGIKAAQGEKVKQLQYKLAALESDSEDITAAGIRALKPGSRLNVKVLFEFGSTELTAGAQEQLDLLGRYLAEGNPSRIVLEGHTDMAGEAEYNQMLSVERARSAKNYLVSEYHISPDIIETQGYGFERLADVDDPFSYKNRRVRVRKLPK